jgi:hypothetical protein
MKVLKATATKKNNLEGIYNNVELKFIQDINDNWVVNDSVLTDDNFIEIREQLNALNKIEYTPKIQTI